MNSPSINVLSDRNILEPIQMLIEVVTSQQQEISELRQAIEAMQREKARLHSDDLSRDKKIRALQENLSLIELNR